MALRLLVGTVLGFLTGLGIGGGSLLILWLTMAMEMEQSVARGINLLFFLPSAVIACLFHWKRGTLPLSRILPALLSGAIAAAVFTWIGTNMDVEILKKLFGVLLIATGLREITYKSVKSG